MALAASAFMIIPSLIQAFAVSRVMMLVGKLLGGLPQGILQVSAANFISEAANVRMRGPLSSLLPLSAIAGIALGLVIGYERIPFVHSGRLIHRSQVPSATELHSSLQIGSHGDSPS
jgi:MFS family permease